MFAFLKKFHQLRIQTRGKAFYKKHAHEIKKFAFFIGYPRSVHSLAGQLLSAHPEILMTHEFDVLGHLDQYAKPQQLLEELCGRYLLEKPFFGKRYNYTVPGLFQSKVQKLTVIGDKRGGKTTEHLYEDFSQLNQLQQFTGLPLRMFHLVRNPYDNIASYKSLMQVSLQQAIDLFANQLYPTTMKVLEHHADKVLTVHAEDLIADTQRTLARMLRFLDLSADDRYFTECAKIVWDKPHSSRWDLNAKWDAATIQQIENKMIKRYPFLNRYRFD